MSRQKILINNVTYIRSRDAARIVHLAPDYVSRLARAELIAGHQVDGLWFVNLASLKEFTNQERQKEAWRAQLAQLRREEQRLRSEEHTSELQSQSNLVCRLLLEKKIHYNSH